MERSDSAPGGLQAMKTFTSGRPFDHKYVSGLLPFTGAPNPGRVMGTHPLSDVRRGCHMPDVSMKEIWKRRKQGNFVLQDSTSEQYEPEAATGAVNEYSSQATLSLVRNKHSRSVLAPCSKYKSGKVSSTAIGWHAETPYGESLRKHPEHGITESVRTKVYTNMKATNMEACLRLCK
ncbi:unnamed protein product [Polarella glacialis]|uniref:Uncharacterized protein n=1 Tax=Polarella glacialis TaxID=89957 RepID=A0A813DNR0_POLGL|nr:unnamed protein product [Polarella glacialis]